MSFDRKPEAVPAKTISIGGLTSMLYFLVSSGPYGIEEAVSAAGLFYAPIFIATIPFVLSLPQSIIYSEMSSFFPTMGSTIMWGESLAIQANKNWKSGTGSKVGFVVMKIISYINAHTLLLKAVFDNAMYPAMFCDYVATYWPEVNERWYWRVLIAAAMFIIIGAVNVLGLQVVGWAQVVIGLFILLPVVLFIGFSLQNASFGAFQYSNSPSKPNFALLLSNLIWQCTGFDQATNLGGEVKNPNRTYPVSFALTVLLVVLTYLMPVLAGGFYEPEAANWGNGALATISQKFPGCQNGWLGVWLTFAGAFSGLSILNCCVSSTAREIYQNAKNGLLPFGGWVGQLKQFRKNKNGDTVNEEAIRGIHYTTSRGAEEVIEQDNLVPHWGILIASVFSVVLLVFPFSFLVSCDSILIIIAMLQDCLFYVVAKHGKYGFLKNNKVTDDLFIVRGGLAVSFLLILFPFAVGIALMYFEGGQLTLYWVIGMAIMMVLTGFDLLFQRFRGCYRVRKRGAVQSACDDDPELAESSTCASSRIEIFDGY